MFADSLSAVDMFPGMPRAAAEAAMLHSHDDGEMRKVTLLRESAARRFPAGPIQPLFTGAMADVLCEGRHNVAAVLSRILSTPLVELFGNNLPAALECVALMTIGTPVFYVTGRHTSMLRDRLQRSTSVHTMFALCADELRGTSLTADEIALPSMRTDVSNIVTEVRRCASDVSAAEFAERELVIRQLIAPLVVVIYGEPLVLTPLETLALVSRVLVSRTLWDAMTVAKEHLHEQPAGMQFAMQFAHSYGVALNWSALVAFDDNWVDSLYWCVDNRKDATLALLPIYILSASYKRLQRLFRARAGHRGALSMRETNTVLCGLREYIEPFLPLARPGVIAAADRCVDAVMLMLEPVPLVDSATRPRLFENVETAKRFAALHNLYIDLGDVLFAHMACAAEQVRQVLLGLPCDRLLEVAVDMASKRSILSGDYESLLLPGGDGEAAARSQRLTAHVFIDHKQVAVAPPPVDIVDDELLPPPDPSTYVAETYLDTVEREVRERLYPAHSATLHTYELDPVSLPAPLCSAYTLPRIVYSAIATAMRRRGNEAHAYSWGVAPPDAPAQRFVVGAGAPSTVRVLFKDMNATTRKVHSCAPMQPFSVLANSLRVHTHNHYVAFVLCTETLQQALRSIEMCNSKVDATRLVNMLPVYPLVVREILAHISTHVNSDEWYRRSDTIGCALRAFLDCCGDEERPLERYDAVHCALYARVLASMLYRSRGDTVRAYFTQPATLQQALFSMVSRACPRSAMRFHAIRIDVLRNIVLPELARVIAEFDANVARAKEVYKACSLTAEEVALTFSKLTSVLDAYDADVAAGKIQNSASGNSDDDDDDDSGNTEDASLYIPLTGHTHNVRRELNPFPARAKRSATGTRQPTLRYAAEAKLDTLIVNTLYRFMLPTARVFLDDACAQVFFAMRCITLRPSRTAPFRWTKFVIRTFPLRQWHRNAACAVSESAAIAYYKAAEKGERLSDIEVFAALHRPRYDALLQRMHGEANLLAMNNNAMSMFRTLECCSRNIRPMDGNKVPFDQMLRALCAGDGADNNHHHSLATPLYTYNTRVYPLEHLIAVDAQGHVPPMNDNALLCERRGAQMHILYQQHTLWMNRIDNHASTAHDVAKNTSVYASNTILHCGAFAAWHCTVDAQ